MLPGLSLQDVANSRSRYAVLLRQSAMLSGCAGVTCPDLPHDVIGQDCLPIPLTSTLPVSFHHVGSIVAVCPGNQVRRVATGGLVAGVPDDWLAVRQFTLEVPIRLDVGTFELAADGRLAVSLMARASSPRPASVWVAVTEDVPCEPLGE